MAQEPRAPGPQVADRPQWPVAADELVLAIDNRAFTGWLEVEVDRTIEAASGAWRIVAANQDPWPARPGAEVRVYAGDERIMTGYVDEVRAELDATSHEFRAGGRDRTADLVDCSVPVDGSELFNVTLDEIAAHVAAPFGVTVTSDLRERFGPLRLPWERFDRFALNPGESAWAAIERAARIRGKLVFATPQGGLRIAEPGGGGRTVADLVLDGESEASNVAVAAFEYRHVDRFQTYTVLGQRPGSDLEWGVAAAHVQGSAIDAEVGRYRPLVVVAHGLVSPEAAKEHAQWEASFRAAQSSRLTVTVPGWRQVPGGPLWRENQLARVRIPAWRMDREFLISALRYSRNRAEGERTLLYLTRPDAYAPQPQVELEGDPWAELVGGEDLDG